MSNKVFTAKVDGANVNIKDRVVSENSSYKYFKAKDDEYWPTGENQDEKYNDEFSEYPQTQSCLLNSCTQSDKLSLRQQISFSYIIIIIPVLVLSAFFC